MLLKLVFHFASFFFVLILLAEHYNIMIMHCHIIFFLSCFNDSTDWKLGDSFRSLLLLMPIICASENVCFNLPKGRIDEPLDHLSTGIPLTASALPFFSWHLINKMPLPAPFAYPPPTRDPLRFFLHFFFVSHSHLIGRANPFSRQFRSNPYSPADCIFHFAIKHTMGPQCVIVDREMGRQNELTLRQRK